MTTALFIWTLVGFAGTQYPTHKEFDWRYAGDFQGIVACQKAAAELNLKPTHFRCIRKNG